MKNLLVDTNIVIDLLAKRQEFLLEAQELFTLADQKQINLHISSLTFANTHYILKDAMKINNTRKILRQFKVLVTVLPMTNKVIDLSLDSDFRDFEDAIQYYIALENNLDIIITRNLKDFKKSKLPVLTAKEYLETKWPVASNK